MTKGKLMKMIDAYAEGRLIRDWVESAVDQYSESQHDGKPIVRPALAELEAEAVEDAYAYSETHEDVSDRIGQHLVKSAYLDGARSVIQKLKANAG